MSAAEGSEAGDTQAEETGQWAAQGLGVQGHSADAAAPSDAPSMAVPLTPDCCVVSLSVQACPVECPAVAAVVVAAVVRRARQRLTR